ncbi:MAG: phosphoribosyltransferase family protein [Pseudomonadota bacterium]
MDKQFISEAQHIVDGFKLGTQIYDSGFNPSFIVGLWRGGSVVGMVVQECLATLGIATDHIALRTSYEGRTQYEDAVQGRRAIRVHGKQYLLETIKHDDRLLIVDDVYSSGRHTQAVVDSLQKALKRNMPEQVRIAAIWWRTQAEKMSSLAPKPDFYLYETQQWLVLPYEAQGLSSAEIAMHKPYLAGLLPSASPLPS